MSADRIAAAAEARLGFPARGGGARLVAARAALARLIWDSKGARKVPAQAALDKALAALPPDELAWLTELTPLGPVYLLPTAPFLRALAATIRQTGAVRVLEVAAGDGHLGRSLAKIAPDLQIQMTDSGAWEKPAARMSASEKREHRGSHLSGIELTQDVLKLEARAAIKQYRPELVLACWLPPGPTLARVIKAPVRYVLEIGAGSGITGDISCWRFPHEFCDGKVESLARCRLDKRPARTLHSRVTLYLGKAHEEFAEEKAHWLSR